VRISAWTLEYGDSGSFYFTDAVQIELGGASILMPQDFLNSAYGQVVLFHDGRPGMPFTPQAPWGSRP